MRRPPFGGVEPLLSVEDLAELCQVPPKTVHRWLYEGTAPPSLRCGKYRRFRRADVEAWLDGLRTKSEQRLRLPRA